MSSSRRASYAPHLPDVNLYCLQCEAQLGIFSNEWLRLTSSYARSKEKGTHFGTEVGQRTQVVPQGIAPNPAIGCHMTEVFCRKCSNMVGQYCKSAPDESKKDIVDQYFYKLSRTFLKDSQTNLRIEPVYGYSDGFTKSTSGRPSSTPIRSSMTPSSRWIHTPLRESSGTPTIQTAARNALQSQQIPSLQTRETQEMAQYESERVQGLLQASYERLDQEAISQNAMLREQSSKIATQAGEITGHEGRIRDHDARIRDQETRMRLQLARIQEQDGMIDEQRETIERQDIQLRSVMQQMQALQNSMYELQQTISSSQHTNSGQQIATIPGNSFIDSFENMLHAVRNAESNSKELESLRSQNYHLQGRLNTIMSAVEAGPVSVTSTEELSPETIQVEHVLGKRKRDDPVVGTTGSRYEESPATKIRRSVRFAEQGVDQIPTPQPSLHDQTPPQKATMTSLPALENEQMQESPPTDANEEMDAEQNEVQSSEQLEQEDANNAEDIIMAQEETDNGVNNANDSLAISEPGTMEAIVAVIEENIVTSDVEQPEALHERGKSLDENLCGNLDGNISGIIENPVNDMLDLSSSSPAAVGEEVMVTSDLPVGDEDNAISINKPIEISNDGFIQDTSMFDAVEFSDDDDDDNLAFGHAIGHDLIDGQTELANNSSSRRVTDTWDGRSERSLAPEPTRRRQTIGGAVAKPISMERIHIGTPAQFEAAILKGIDPRAQRPIPIKTRQKRLHDELTRLGLAEWIPKDKKNKEYRAAVMAARARYRNSQKVAVLNANGLTHDEGAENTCLPEKLAPEQPSVAAKKVVLAQIYNLSNSVGPQGEPTPGDENTPSFQSKEDRGGDQGATTILAERIETNQDQRVTRARARRSDLSLDVNINNSENELRTHSPMIERPSRKRKSGGNEQSQKQQNSITQSVNIVIPQDSNMLDAANTQPDEPIETSTQAPTRGRGRPRKSNDPTQTNVEKPEISSPQLPNSSTQHQQQSGNNSQTLPMPTKPKSTNPIDRQQLLEKMKTRAEERDNAIALRDRLAKETMEREMAIGV